MTGRIYDIVTVVITVYTGTVRMCVFNCVLRSAPPEGTAYHPVGLKADGAVYVYDLRIGRA